MARSLASNTFLALLWLFLTDGGMPEFVEGFLFGFLALALFPNMLSSHDYVRRTLALLKFLLIFFKEFAVANWTIAKAVLIRKNDDIHPNIITYDVAGLDAFEIYLLSQTITLTPGTTTLDLVNDGKTLLIHAFDADDVAAVRTSIDNSLRRGILAFTR